MVQVFEIDSNRYLENCCLKHNLIKVSTHHSLATNKTNDLLHCKIKQNADGSQGPVWPAQEEAFQSCM